MIIEIIKHYPICYIFVPIQLGDCIEELQGIFFPQNEYDDEDENEEDDEGEGEEEEGYETIEEEKYLISKAMEVLFLVISYILEIFVILMFIEILEIKILGLNKYFKRNIRERSISDVYLSFHMQRDTTDIDGMIVDFDEDGKDQKEIKEKEKNILKDTDETYLNQIGRAHV